jgi:hypothetical protein
MFRRANYLLVPRLACGNKDDLIKLKSVSGLRSRNKVAMVNWVKSSTHHANARPLGVHGLLVASLLVRAAHIAI